MSNKEVVVTLSRVYFYNLDILDGKTIEDKKNDAIHKAYCDFAEEVTYFSLTPQDFVSHKVKIDTYDGKGTKENIK